MSEKLNLALIILRKLKEALDVVQIEVQALEIKTALLEDAMRPEPKTLTKEMATFEKILPHLINKNQGRFVLIHGEDVIKICDFYIDAEQTGKTLFKSEPFLVKCIQ